MALICIFIFLQFLHVTSHLTWDQRGCLQDCPPAVMAPQPPCELALAAQAMCGLFIHQPPLLLGSQLLLKLQSIRLLPQSILIPEEQKERMRWETKKDSESLWFSFVSWGPQCRTALFMFLFLFMSRITFYNICSCLIMWITPNCIFHQNIKAYVSSWISHTLLWKQHLYICLTVFGLVLFCIEN